MGNTLFKKCSLLKFAAVTSLFGALVACSDNSSSVTYVMIDDYGNEHVVPFDNLKSSSSVKRRSSSSSVSAASSSSVRAAASSSSVGREVRSSSAKAVSSSSAKLTVSSSSATTPKSSAIVPVSSAAFPKSSAATPASSSAKIASSSAAKPVSSSATVAQSSSAKVASSSSAKIVSSSSVKAPASSATTNSFFSENWRQACLDKINEYRATENLAPLSLAPEEKQTCTDKQAGDDLAENKAHGHFQACGEWAQNSGPNFNTSWRKTAIEVSDAYLKMMWEDEKALVTSGERDPKKDEDYPYIGHYLNMKGNYKTVACGIALTEDGKKGWFNVNFF